MDTSKTISNAREALSKQSASIALISDSLGQGFIDSVELIAHAPKVVTTGLGKSGFIARKMAATLSSVRIPAIYIHPVDAVHGDSGLLSHGDVMVAFSKSGETAEVVRIAQLAKRLGVKVISITARAETTLTDEAHASVLAPIQSEYDAHSVLPTASTTAALIVADLLSVQAVELRGDVVERLQASHPEGAIGAALLRTVDEVMHGGDLTPIINEDALVADALMSLSASGLGIVCICSHDQQLKGIVTDGDIRRLMANGTADRTTPASSVMTSDPITVSSDVTLHEALAIMENKERQLNVLPVVVEGRVVGVLRLHDVVRANM